MNRTAHVFLPMVMITMGMSGCAAYNNEARARAAVDKRQMEPTPSTISNAHNRENFDSVSVTHEPKNRIVQVGDVLVVIVAEDHSFSGYYEVRLGGYFILPAVGRIEAVGLPLKEVEANVTKALEETQLAHATVTVTKLSEAHSGRYR